MKKRYTTNRAIYFVSCPDIIGRNHLLAFPPTLMDVDDEGD
jgi:hypothetical protein